MVNEITRAQAIAAFAERHPSLPPDELEDLFHAWMQADCLDFVRGANGQWQVRLRSPRRKQ
jgi:hypothetical protein